MQIRFESDGRRFAVTFWQGEGREAAFTYAVLSEVDEDGAWRIRYTEAKEPRILKGRAKRHEGDAVDPRLARRVALKRLLDALSCQGRELERPEYAAMTLVEHDDMEDARLAAANLALAEREKPALTFVAARGATDVGNLYGSRENLARVALVKMRHLGAQNVVIARDKDAKTGAGWYLCVYGAWSWLEARLRKEGFRIISREEKAAAL